MKRTYTNLFVFISLFFMLFVYGYSENISKQPKLSRTENEFLQRLEKDTISLPEVKQYIKLGMNIEVKDKEGNTPLILASRNGNYGIARYLIEEGANVEAKDYAKATPLVVACGHHHLCPQEHNNLVRLLVLSGANVNYDGGEEYGSPLFEAAYNGHVELIKFLVENGADVNLGNISPLWGAAYAGNIRVMEDLIKYGADIDKKMVLPNGESIPMSWWAINEKNTPVLDFLLNHGANSNDTVYNQPLLHFAIQNEFWKGANLLVLAGANVNMKDDYGYTPLIEAVSKNSFAMVKLLLERGAKINVCNQNGKNALSYASTPAIKNYLKSRKATLICASK